MSPTTCMLANAVSLLHMPSIKPSSPLPLRLLQGMTCSPPPRPPHTITAISCYIPLHPSPPLRSVQGIQTLLVMRTLGIAHTKDTPVGDSMLRGVSGGERKRVTLAEM